MKFLFDANLSPSLAINLQDEFPGSVHVEELALAAEDSKIWAYAAQNEFVIVSKDSDFHDRSSLSGHPPKVVWLRVGNCATETVETLLRERLADLRDFFEDTDKAFLVLS